MEINWTDMVHYQQQIQKITRLLLPVKQADLTVSECELLACLYFNRTHNTPVLLSQQSGMKKEAVSRCLKNLFSKDCIRKERQPGDERSYQIFLTDTGIQKLQEGYKTILQPFYDLWRNAGTDFENFLHYADKIISHIETEQEGKQSYEIL